MVVLVSKDAPITEESLTVEKTVIKQEKMVKKASNKENGKNNKRKNA